MFELTTKLLICSIYSLSHSSKYHTEYRFNHVKSLILSKAGTNKAVHTENNGSRTSVDVAYLKEGVIVNRTNGSLDTGIIFKSSKRSVVHMEILNEDWVETEWESMIEEIDF